MINALVNMYINTAFLKFRIRQFWGFIKEIPIPYLIIMLIMISAALIALYAFMESLQGSLLIGGIFLLFIVFIHLRRKDYHFICLVDTSPWRVFLMDYVLISLPLTVTRILQGYWFVSIGILLVCGTISFIRQPFHQVTNGFPVPHFIPWELFEIRTGFRRYGGWLLLIYGCSFAGLFLPYLSLVLLWLYTAFMMEFFRICESKAILCSSELSVKKFIRRKGLMNVGFYILTILPVCILYIFIRPQEWWLVFIFFVLASLNVFLFILYKYAVFEPGKKIMSGQVSLGLSVLGIVIPVFAPFTFLLLIRYTIMANRNLIPFLYAYN